MHFQRNVLDSASLIPQFVQHGVRQPRVHLAVSFASARILRYHWHERGEPNMPAGDGLEYDPMDSTNPFAAPGSMGIVDIVPTSGAYWHEGKLLVALPNAELPARCPKCNVPVDDHRKRYNLSWYPPIAYAGLLLGVLPFLLIVLVARKRLAVYASVCREHRRRRIRDILVGWCGFALGFLLMLAAIPTNANSMVGTVVLLFAVVLVIGSLIFMAIRSRVIWAKRIDRKQAWVYGFCPEYLQEIP